MKDEKKIFFIISILIFTIICGCSSDDPINPADLSDEELLINEGNEWGLANGGSVDINGANITDDWSNFSILIKHDGTYTTSGSADLEVWPSSGGWQLMDDQILRSDGIILDFNVTSDMLQLSFHYEENGRLKGTEGGYRFIFYNE